MASISEMPFFLPKTVLFTALQAADEQSSTLLGCTNPKATALCSHVTSKTKNSKSS